MNDPFLDVHQRMIRDTESLRREFLKTVETTTIERVASLAGLADDSLVKKWRDSAQIFSIKWREVEYFPSFQFGRDGHPLPIIGEVLSILRRDSDLTQWDVALWFAGDTGWLDGKTPIECLETKPDAVKRAALQEALFDTQ